MLKIKRCLALQSLARNMYCRQYFSIIYFNEKQFDSAIYDVLIQDIDQDIDGQDLHGKISQLLGKSYLSPLKNDQDQYAEIRIGTFYGSGRGIITIPTSFKNKNPIWVHYLIVTGAPYTYLSKQALDALNLDQTQNRYSVFINNKSNQVRHSTAHFAKINILGMDYLQNRVNLNYDMINKIITLTDHKKEN